MTDEAPPLAWLSMHRHLLPPAGQALDVACGSGRHALWLARQGFRVLAVDRDAAVITALSAHPLASAGRIEARVHDLETGRRVIDPDAFDVVVVTHYLHRPLLPQLVAALRPGGVLVYETFTTAQAARGKPTNPDFLLRPGELVTLVRPLAILAEREGEFDGRLVAGVVARRRD
jgi:2-polyprenyl-3-methyl-5-hydroxy-6-metoxy-1,4-benzoquinol methylase